MKLMNIVSCGYRATVEEQDDTVVWITHCLRNAGAEVDLLLRGAAVNYPVTGQAVDPVNIGGRGQKHAPDVHGQIRDFLGNGSKVYAVREDVEERAIDPSDMLQQVELVSRLELPALLSGYEQVWHW